MAAEWRTELLDDDIRSGRHAQAATRLAALRTYLQSATTVDFATPEVMLSTVTATRLRAEI